MSTIALDAASTAASPLDSNVGLNAVYLVVLSAVTVIGNIGNVMVIGAVLTDRRLRKEGNIFILNLAVADLCVTSFVDPASIAGVFHGPDFWQRNSGLCHAIGMVCTASCVCSLWSIGAISLNRYILICRRHIYNRVYTQRSTTAMCLGIWLATILLDLPNFLDWGDHSYDMKTMSCSYDRTASYSYTVFFITMFVAIPLLVVVICNLNIYILVLKSKRRVATHGQACVGEVDERTAYQGDAVYSDDGTIATDAAANTQQPVAAIIERNNHLLAVPRAIQVVSVSALVDTTSNVASTRGSSAQSFSVIQSQTAVAGKNSRPRAPNMKSEMRLAKTLFIIFIAFVICWAPYALICLIDQDDKVSKEVYTVAILFAHSSSTLNSVLYAATNKGFREGYKLFLNRCGCKIS